MFYKSTPKYKTYPTIMLWEVINSYLEDIVAECKDKHSLSLLGRHQICHIYSILMYIYFKLTSWNFYNSLMFLLHLM